MKEDFNPNILESDLSFKIRVESAEKSERSDDSEFCSFCGILDPRRDYRAVMKVPFQSGCGSDNICYSDLSILVSPTPDLDPPFVIGSSEFVTLLFIVNNLRGDPAFQPKIEIPMPQGISLRKTTKECTFQVSKT